MRSAFTLIELLVVVSIIALLIAILLPALGAARQSARQMQNSVNLRSLHQGTIVFSMENKDWYQGLSSEGAALTANEVIEASGLSSSVFWPNPGQYVMPRFALLAFNDIVAYEHLVSPEESGKTREVWNETDRFSHRYLSYAALHLGGFQGAGGGRMPVSGNDAARAWNA